MEFRPRASLLTLLSVAALLGCQRPPSEPASEVATEAVPAPEEMAVEEPAEPAVETVDIPALELTVTLPEGWSELADSVDSDAALALASGPATCLAKGPERLPVVYVLGIAADVYEPLTKAMEERNADPFEELFGRLKESLTGSAAVGKGEVTDEAEWTPAGIQRGKSVLFTGPMPDLGIDDGVVQVMYGVSSAGGAYMIAAGATDRSGLDEALRVVGTMAFGRVPDPEADTAPADDTQPTP